MAIVFEDIRSLVFPLVAGSIPEDPETPLVLQETEFLGTGFFVSGRGVAVTAAHLLQVDFSVHPDLIAIVWDGNEARCHKVIASLVPDNSDVAIITVGGAEADFLRCDFERVHMGEEVVAIGIPADSDWNEDRDYRLFKGHVTRSKRLLELNFPALRGMSGGPVLRDGRVVGVVSGNHRSEALEDQLSEVTEKSDGFTKTLDVRTVSVVNYGLIEPLSLYREFSHPLLDDKSLPEFLGS